MMQNTNFNVTTQPPLQIRVVLSTNSPIFETCTYYMTKEKEEILL